MSAPTLPGLLVDAFMALFIPKATLMGLTIVIAVGWWGRRGQVAEADKLREENERLRAWQGQQARTPALGAHRTSTVIALADLTGAATSAARRRTSRDEPHA